MPDRSFHVVALSFPIVYNGDGDHDRNGLMYALARYVPLLEFVREQWELDDEWLPEAHRRRQLIVMLLDGLTRYRAMVSAFGGPLTAHRDLLKYVGRVAAEEEDEDGGPDMKPAEREILQNYKATVDELATVLNELTEGRITEVARDPRVRQQWTATWRSGLVGLNEAIEKQLLRVQQNFDASLPTLAARSGLSQATVRRLMLNDHASPTTIVTQQVNGYDLFNPLRPVALARPMVLRARHHETVEVVLENRTRRPHVGLHRQGAGLDMGVRGDDGAHVGRNPDTTAARGHSVVYRWQAEAEGVWPLNDLADVRGTENGTNVHGLFGAFIVEPTDATWHDPETGELLGGAPGQGGGDVGALYVDVHRGSVAANSAPFVDFATDGDGVRGFREFTVFIHDEPEIHSALHLGPEHTVMPLSYRAEPMPNRLPHRMREYARQTREGGTAGLPGTKESSSPHELRAVRRRIDRHTLSEVFDIGRRDDGSWIEQVAGEEQHHSSWLFKDPTTPILRAYRGDPSRIRLVHAGVKETHVFHLHVHQWRAVATDPGTPSAWRPDDRRGSQLLDSITIGPQSGFDIDPLYGSGSRQHLFGDIIWHCHLYPHFHHGMWGLWRSFDRLVDGSRPYPDGTPCHALAPLPGREPLPGASDRPAPVDKQHPGFPWFIDAGFPQKAPPPPAKVDAHVQGRRRLLGLKRATSSEEQAFANGAEDRPGAPFVALDTLAETWNEEVELPKPRVLSYDVEVTRRPVTYNSLGWHDKKGHFYRLSAVNGVRILEPDEPEQHEPFFVRANHGDVVELRLHNLLGPEPADDFDLNQLAVECGLHVHLVKFDVLAADGSSTGWNYLSGASCSAAVEAVDPGAPPGNIGLHRWVVDEEFGPCFFHDHLLANYRQKHGLFAALVAQPPRSTWLEPTRTRTAWSGASAVVEPGPGTEVTPYREACLAIGDFVPLYDRVGKPLNPPGKLAGDDDPGAMAVNYRSSPLTARGPDPSQWFATDERRRGRTAIPVLPKLSAPPEPDEAGSSAAIRHHSWLTDPDTPIIETYPDEHLRIRLIQGSHEEQHSFATHGLRWRREWQHRTSTLVNQQTLGISEAFTLDLDPAKGSTYGIGDHLWRLSAMDDLWLGCWGLVRVLPPGSSKLPPLVGGTTAAPFPRPRGGRSVRYYTVRARRVEHHYDGDHLTDPWGLVYEVVPDAVDAFGDDGPEGSWLVDPRPSDPDASPEPLVLRCSPGEWVCVRLINDVRRPRDAREAVQGWPRVPAPPRSDLFEDPWLPPFGPEPDPPRLPLDEDERTVSDRVSLHPALLQYDVVTDDGAYVGTNRDGTVRPLPLAEEHGHGPNAGAVVRREGHGHERSNWREYWWYADEALGEDLGQVCYLHDMADIRNHRHHGLVGAVVVEPEGWTPDSWTGTHTVVRRGDASADEQVLFWQDGLRHYLSGDPDSPVRDVVPGDDPEDAGQKGVNYRSARVHPRDPLNEDDPPTPTWSAPTGRPLWLRLVGACDKPRNHTFTVHGRQWRAAPWLGRRSPEVGALSGLTADVVHDLDLGPVEHPGDHAYRSGAFRWAVTQGMWGIVRVE